MSNYIENYKPKKLVELIGQPAAQEALRTVISGSSQRNLLLVGGPGTGKTVTAESILPMLYACENFSRLGDACGDCKGCRTAAEANWFDLLGRIICNAGDNTEETIKAEVVRAIANQPGRTKFVLFDEIADLPRKLQAFVFSMMSRPWAEVLSEILNIGSRSDLSPDYRVIFIFATTTDREYRILPALASRVMKVRYVPVSDKLMIQHLSRVAQKEGMQISQDALELIAFNVEGDFRQALLLLQEAAERRMPIDIALAERILRRPPERAYLEILRCLRHDFQKLHRKLEALLAIAEPRAYVKGFTRVVQNLRAFTLSYDADMPIPESLRESYRALAKTWTPDEVSLMTSSLYHPKFKDTNSPRSVVDQTMDMAYRLSKVEPKTRKQPWGLGKKTYARTMKLNGGRVL